MGVINQELTDPRRLSVWAQVKAAAEDCIQKQDLGALDIQKMVKPMLDAAGDEASEEAWGEETA